MTKGASKPRTKPSEERRDDLMNAAQELFLQRGLADTTVDQITSAADVAKGTFYLYFTSKEDVLVALRDRFRANFIAEVDATVHRHGGDWRGTLLAWIKTGVTTYVDAVALHDLLFHLGHCPRRDKLRNNKAVEHLSVILAEGTAAKAWRVVQPKETAVVLLYGLHGLIDLALIADKPPNKRRLIQTAQGLALRIVGIA